MRVSTLYNSRSGRIYSEAEMPDIFNLIFIILFG